MIAKKYSLLIILFFSFNAQGNVICGDPKASDIKNSNDCYVTGHIGGNYQKSIQYAKKVLAKEPNNARANALIAFSYMRMSQYNEAVPFFKRAINLGANTFDVYGLYGMTLEAIGDTEGAIKWYRQALIIFPGLTDVTGKLANLLAKSGRQSEAIELLEKFDSTQIQRGKQPIFQGQIMVIKEGIENKNEATTTPSSISQRLQTLKDLYDKGLITKDDYEKKKSQIMSEM